MEKADWNPEPEKPLDQKAEAGLSLQTSAGPRQTTDWAALVLLLTAIAVAIFYPENFVRRPPWSLGPLDITPLDLLFPFMLAGVLVYAVVRRPFKAGLQEIIILAFFSFLVARNLATQELLASIKYLVYGAGVYWLAQSLTSREPVVVPAACRSALRRSPR